MLYKGTSPCSFRNREARADATTAFEMESAAVGAAKKSFAGLRARKIAVLSM